MIAINTTEFQELERAIEEIHHLAKEFGLDFFPMRFEICPAEIIYTFGAYGMPTRYSHWSFGKNFHRMKTQYDYNLSRIYELVINSDPCYAFLLDGNTLIQNKLVIAHVFAHCDFFKNNAAFRVTSRQMVETMSVAAERFMEYEFNYGKDEVERFIDAVLAIQEHVDPQEYMAKKDSKKDLKKTTPFPEYDDLWQLDKESETTCSSDKAKKYPPCPEKDLLSFLATNARELEHWQRDVITTLRQEMLYFWPQIETKIMNEGWASYWHMRILRELDLDEKEAIEYAKLNAQVTQKSPTSLNPYHVGLKIWEDIEKRWGREKMFEVREMDTDISFIRNYLTKELVEEMDLYIFRKVDRDWRITDKEWEKVRDGIVGNLVNGGFPYIVVTDGDYEKTGQLYLTHQYEGVELDMKYLEKALPYVYRIWQKTVHLETRINDKPVVFSYDGSRNTRKFL